MKPEIHQQDTDIPRKSAQASASLNTSPPQMPSVDGKSAPSSAGRKACERGHPAVVGVGRLSGTAPNCRSGFLLSWWHRLVRLGRRLDRQHSAGRPRDDPPRAGHLDRGHGDHLRRARDGFRGGDRENTENTELLPRYLLPEYEASLETKHVVFEQIVIARHALCIHARQIEHLEKVRDDPVRWTYAYYLPKLWQLYEKTEGKIVEHYFCNNTLAGVILNKKGDLVVRYLPQDVAHVSPGFESTLWKCTVQARLTNQLLLKWGGRKVLLRRLFSLAVYLLTVLDSQKSSHLA
jgi:hypothetical protein